MARHNPSIFIEKNTRLNTITKTSRPSIGPLEDIAVRFGGSEKVFPESDPYGGLWFYDRAFGLFASPTFLEPPRVARVQSRGQLIL